MLQTLKQALSNYDLIPITPQNQHRVWEIYYSNFEYFLATRGRGAAQEDIMETIRRLPPGYNAQKQVFVSIWRMGRPVAVLDLLPGLIGLKGLWLSELIIHADLQGQGLAAVIVQAIVQAARQAGLNEIRLGVMKKNANVVPFWEKMGFEQISAAGDIYSFKRGL